MRFDAYPPSETVVIEGELGTEMFFISKGKLKVLVKETQIGTLQEGDFFGEVAMYHNKGRRTATVIATTYCEVRTHDKYVGCEAGYTGGWNLSFFGS